MKVEELIRKLEKKPKINVVLTVYSELKSDARYLFTTIIALISLFITITSFMKAFHLRLITIGICFTTVMLMLFGYLKVEKLLDKLHDIMISDNMDKHTKNALRKALPLITYFILGLIYMIIAAIMS